MEVGEGGFVDYALFIGTKLVGLIEAKASYKNVSSVIDYQCKDYARNISAADKKYSIDLRDYQLKAVQAVENAVIAGQKNILLAMATGTGKTFSTKLSSKI